MRLIGPNTTGILNPKVKFTSTFTPLSGVKEGNVAFIAQTGMFAGVMLNWILTAERFGISKVAGLGNKTDVTETEILQYLSTDDDTKVIMIYLEGVKEGKAFLEVAKGVTKRKPIILLKGGRTSAGAKAALSHTGSVAGNYEILHAALNQAGIIPAQDLEEMVDWAKIFSFQPLPQGRRTGIVSMSGGAAVMAADACAEFGLELAELKAETLDRLQQLLPAWAKASHPMDLEPLAEVVGRVEAYRVGLELVLSDPNVDCCLLNISAFGERDLPPLIPPLIERYPKPVAINIIGPKEEYEFLSLALEERKIPVYPTGRRAAKSLSALYRYQTFKGKNV
jgi:acyl-CoA synthetase (NDP forming)